MAYPTDMSRIEAAEREIGRRLPDALRRRLLKDNGGDVAAMGTDWQLHPVWDPTSKRTMRKTANHILIETEAARKWRGFPEGAISIAANGTGDLLVLRAGSNDIEWWDHETRMLERVLDLKWE